MPLNHNKHTCQLCIAVSCWVNIFIKSFWKNLPYKVRWFITALYRYILSYNCIPIFHTLKPLWNDLLMRPEDKIYMIFKMKALVSSVDDTQFGPSWCQIYFNLNGFLWTRYIRGHMAGKAFIIGSTKWPREGWRFWILGTYASMLLDNGLIGYDEKGSILDAFFF